MYRNQIVRRRTCGLKRQHKGISLRSLSLGRVIPAEKVLVCVSQRQQNGIALQLNKGIKMRSLN